MSVIACIVVPKGKTRHASLDCRELRRTGAIVLDTRTAVLRGHTWDCPRCWKDAGYVLRGED